MRYFSLLLFGSCSTLAPAQWTSDTQANTSVRSGAGIDAATPLMSDGPDGSTYVSWFDNQPGGYQLRMQRLDANGYRLWAEEGLLVSDHPQNSALFRYDLKSDHAGNAIVAFQDERSAHLDIVVYKMDPAGNQLWGEDGIALTDPASTQGLAPVIGVLVSNEVVIAWNADDGSDKWVAVQHLLEDGTLPWATPYAITGPDKYSRPKVIPTSDNGAFVQYVREVGNFPYTCTMHALRVDGNGNVTGDVAVSTKTISAFFFPEPVTDGHDGFYVPFTTGNPDNAALSDAYVQRVRADFSAWSATGTELLTGTGTHRFSGGLALMNDIMGLLAPVKVTNTGQSEGGWSVQGLDTAGTVQLGPTGVEVVASGAQLATPDGVASTGDGCIVVYSEGGFGQEHVHATRLGYQGNQVWGGPIAVCSANSNKDDAACGRFGNDGQVVAVWQDDRIGSGIYAQNISSEGSTGPTAIADPVANGSSLRLLANPSVNAVLLFGEGAVGPRLITTFDAAGRTVGSERMTAAAGAGIALRTGHLVRGVYTIRVEAASGICLLRWVKE